MLTIAGGIILGWLGIVVLRAIFSSDSTPTRRVALPPAPISIGEFDREARQEFVSTEARRNHMGLGFFIAIKAVLERKPFDHAFDEVQRTMTSESALESATTRIMVMLYAIGTMPSSTWKDAQAKMQAVPDDVFEHQIRAWQDVHLRQYFGWTMRQFKELSELPSFQAFAVLADQWTLGIRALPPQWWK